MDRRASGVFRAGFRFGVLFNLHVAKLFGVKDIATFQAFDKLTIFVPGNNAYLRVFADGCHRSQDRWNKVPFPQIVSAFPRNSYRNLVNIFIPLVFWRGQKRFPRGLVIPTETVVY